MRFRTKAVHIGQEKDPSTGATIPPVHLTSTFTQKAPGKHNGYEYSRAGNPTRASLEQLIASLENGSYGLAFSSGMAATHAVLSALEKGAHIIISTDVYGGTFRLADKFLADKGYDFSYIDTTDIESVKKALRPETKMVLIETPSNPLLKIMDIKGIKEVIGNILLAVDNTFATPYFQRPLDLGADIVLHSSTKYLGGHSDLIGGAVVIRDKQLHEKVKFIQNAVGSVPSPFDCYLLIRSIKTLALRMEAHQENAQIIARFLDKRPEIEEVYFPGLESNRYARLAKDQMSGLPGIVSFKLKGGQTEVKTFLSKLKIFSLAESLGGVESLVSVPSLMTHASFSQELKDRAGISENLIRLSVGVEDSEDLVSDLKQAFIS